MHGDWLSYEGTKTARSQRVLVDFHFQLSRLNVDADAEWLGWASEHGLLDWFTGDAYTPSFEFVGYEGLGAAVLWAERERLWRADAGLPGADTRLEWRVAVAAVTDMIRARRWAFEGVEPDDWSSPEWFWPKPDNAFDAISRTVAAINMGLQAFGPRAEVYQPGLGEFPGYRVFRITDASRGRSRWPACGTTCSPGRPTASARARHANASFNTSSAERPRLNTAPTVCATAALLVHAHRQAGHIDAGGGRAPSRPELPHVG